ncbi:MAG: hypothetical protein AAFX87_29135 [Bacteroidota bacterium]
MNFKPTITLFSLLLLLFSCQSDKSEGQSQSNDSTYDTTKVHDKPKNESLDSTTEAFNRQNEALYQEIKARLEKDTSAQAKAQLRQLIERRHKSTDLLKFLDSTKLEMKESVSTESEEN